jgi:hypothetical protein
MGQTVHNFEANRQRFRRTVARQLIEVGATLTERHRAMLGVPYPPASKEGEYPHHRSGLLQVSVDYEPKTADQVIANGKVTVSYDLSIAPHGEYMAGMGRLGISDTKDRVRPELEAVFRGEVPGA